ncbi:MAG: AAA family ATPase [bacterium]|nr:AAA family ATPase [bacterium]
MKRRFNDTGVCIPDEHFMVDISKKTAAIFKMVQAGNYFVISKPRQYSKTTTLFILNKFLECKDGYYPLKMSFEGIGSDSYKNEAVFIKALMVRLKRIFTMDGNKQLVEFVESASHIDVFVQLDVWLTELITLIGKKTILMIDEVDKSCNNQLFLDFPGLMRAKFLRQKEGEDTTFHSVILVGVHDVKNLKIKLRPNEAAQYNSPWNIAVDFKVSMEFLPDEIQTMLETYAAERGVKMDCPAFAQRIFYFTSGYPFLVSHLCKIIDEEILPHRKQKEWLPSDVEEAAQIAQAKDNTNFESLEKNLENNPDLYDFVFKIIMDGREFAYNRRNKIISRGMLFGVLKEDNKKVRIHNRIYQQVIYDYMSSGLEISNRTPSMKLYNTPSSYIEKDGSLNIERVLRKFQEFMMEQYSVKDKDFIERSGRLLFLAFVKPIINGKGFDFKEVQVSEEKRLDVVITYGKFKYIVELKIWRGETYHQEGIKQLCDYLERQNQNVGYLLIYDLRKKMNCTGKYEKTAMLGKTIHTAWL